jgi:hypothetical protein
MIDYGERPESYESSDHCTDCDVLTEALRDLEQQCREAEDGRILEVLWLASKNPNQLLSEENAYLVRIKKLEHRRNCALEVLLKHQSLEHREL